MPNQLTLRRYGRYRTSPDGDSGQVSSGVMRASVFNRATHNIWVTALGGFLGRPAGSNPTVRIAVYATDGSMAPDERVGYSAAFSVTNLAGSSPETQSYTAAVQVADNAPTNAALKLHAGKRYALAVLPTGNGLVHAMVSAGNINADNEQFYTRSSTTSQPPPSSFGSYASSIEGHMTLWAEGWENEPPLPAVNRQPYDTIDTTTPRFEGDFRDRNGAYGASSGSGVDTGDRLNQYQIQLRRVGTSTLLWNATYTASSTERANNRFSRAYGGSTLTRGLTYEWRVRMSDDFGAWGEWSDWLQFTPANLGYVTLNGSPTGKIESVTPSFEARWTHQSGLATNAVQIRLETPEGAVLQTSPTIAKSVSSSAAPGTLFTITWAETGFSPLAWGTAYRYRVRGRDTNNQWSDWSAPRTFATNAAPGIPSNLSPANSQVVTALPLLTCSASDVDDTTATGLIVKCRIKDSDGTVLQTRTMTYNAATKRWTYQTTVADLASFGTYRWDAYSYDGTLYSGEQTVEANAVASSEAVFQYAQGPVVAVTSPADDAVLTTVTPTVQWTVTSGGPQAKYRVRIYPDGESTPLFDTGWVVGAATSYDVPTGYLRNATAYDLVVSVENNVALQGDSTPVNFSVSLTPPDPPDNFQVDAYQIGTDPWPTAIRLSWDQTTLPSGEFVEYTIRRWASGGPDAEAIVLARITDPTTVTYVDYHPASGYTYTYELTQTQQVGTDLLTSDAVSGSAAVQLGGLVVTLLANPEAYRAYAIYRRAGSGIGRDMTRQIVETVYPPVAGTRSAPRTYRSRARWVEWEHEAELVGDQWATAMDRLAEWEALDEAVSQGLGGTLCLRDERGRKLFAVLSAFSATDEWPDRASINARFREEAYTEGAP